MDKTWDFQRAVLIFITFLAYVHKDETDEALIDVSVPLSTCRKSWMIAGTYLFCYYVAAFLKKIKEK